MLNRAQRLLLGLTGLAAAACSDQSTSIHASLFGQSDVTLTGDFASVGDVQEVLVGGIHAYNLRSDGKNLTVTLQGAPTPGTMSVEVHGSKGTLTLEDVLAYDSPATGVPLRWVAFGASLTQGTESGGIDTHTQVNGCSGQIARAAGVYLGLPLMNPLFASETKPSDFNPDCSAKAGSGPTLQDRLTSLTNPETNEIDLRRTRVDPTLTPRNYAAGGSSIDEVLHGGQVVKALLERIIFAPESPGDLILEPLGVSQIDRIEQLDPDVGFSADLLANDTDASVIQEDDLHPELVTSVEAARPTLNEIARRLGKLHGQFFIANMPSLTFVPNVVALRQRRLEQQQDTTESFDAKVKQIDDLVQALNQALEEAMKPYPNLHLVDFHGRVEEIRKDGVRVGSTTLQPVKFGGLLSLDDLHFTDTGYAVVANLFIDTMNPVLHSHIPPVDLAAVHAADPLSPKVLRAAGLTCAPQE